MGVEMWTIITIHLYVCILFYYFHYDSLATTCNLYSIYVKAPNSGSDFTIKSETLLSLVKTVIFSFPLISLPNETSPASLPSITNGPPESPYKNTQNQHALCAFHNLQLTKLLLMRPGLIQIILSVILGWPTLGKCLRHFSKSLMTTFACCNFFEGFPNSVCPQPVTVPFVPGLCSSSDSPIVFTRCPSLAGSFKKTMEKSFS